jgi:hypothetical protein
MYTNVIIVCKFVFQISLFCVCCSGNSMSYSMYPTCAESDAQCQCALLQNVSIHNEHTDSVCFFKEELHFPYVLGIIKISGIFLEAVFMDLGVLLTVLWHRSVLKKNVSSLLVLQLKYTHRDCGITVLSNKPRSSKSNPLLLIN